MNILIYSDDKKQNIVGIICYSKKDDDVNFEVYKASDNGLKHLDLIGNHIYNQIVDQTLIDKFIEGYVTEYFNGCYYEK